MSGLFDRVRELAEQDGGRPALRRRRVGGAVDVTTRRELVDRACGYAALFSERAGPIVPLLLDRDAPCVAAMLGALAAGRAFLTPHRRLKAAQLERILESVSAPLAVVDASARRALAGTTGAAELVPVEDAPEGPVPAPLPPDPDRVGAVLFTSGSTGTPKGVNIAADDLERRADAEVRWYGLDEGDVLLGLLPFSFDVGLNQLCSALAAGATLALADAWLPADLLDAAAALEVTGVSGVPSLWSDMLAADLRFDRSGPHRRLRYLTVSGGDLAGPQLERLPALADGAGIFKTYGQTEAFRATSLRPEEFAARPRSVGRPFPGAAVHVLRADGGECAPDELGEVVHAGLGTMLGYLDGDDAGKRVPNPFRSAAEPFEWAIRTGDLGRFDADGYLHLEGRTDDLFKVADTRVHPREIAEPLLRDPDVAEVEVIRDERGVVIAAAVARVGAALDPEGLLRELRRSVPAFLLPGRIVLVDAIPRTSSGKPDRAALIDALKRG